MRLIVLTLGFAALGLSQSFHIIRVIPSGATPGSVLFCGNATNATACVTDQANTAGTAINTSGSRVVGTSDNAFLAIDAGGSERLGFTKQTGFIPRLTYGSGNNFELAQSNATDIGAGNTYTVHFALDATSGAPTFTFNSAATGAVFTQSGAGSAISVTLSNASAAASIANTGAGNAVSASANSGVGVLATSASGNGVSGSSNSGIGVLGTGVAPIGSATGVKGIGNGTAGIGVYASGPGAGGTGGIGLFSEGLGSGGLAAHFASGTVQIDNTLNLSGSFTGTHGQNVGSGDGPTFAQLQINGTAAAGSTRPLSWFTSGSPRWIAELNGSEAGANAGSNFTLERWSDAGSFLGNAISIVRSTGITTLSSLVVSNAASFGSASISASTGGPAFSSTNAGGGSAILGTDSSGFGTAVAGTSGGGISVSALGTGAGDALRATNSGGGLAAHFVTGNVTIDHDLTISGTCTGCASGGVTSISSTGNGLSFSASTGAVSASLSQDIRTTANPTFASVTANPGGFFTSGGYGINGSGSVSLLDGIMAGSLSLTSEDQYLSVDAGGNTRLGLTKKTGVNPLISFGSGIDFVIAQSSAASINPANSFTAKFTINSSTGAVTIANLAGAGNLPACIDSAGKLYAGSNTVGVLSCP